MHIIILTFETCVNVLEQRSNALHNWCFSAICKKTAETFNNTFSFKVKHKNIVECIPTHLMPFTYYFEKFHFTNKFKQ